MDNVARDGDEPGLMRGGWRAAASPLWIAGLITLIVVSGAAWLPAIIQFFGRGGQRETVEWLVYLVLGTVFPVVAAGLAWFGPRILARRWLRVIDGALAAFLLVCSVVFFVTLGAPAFLLSGALAVLTMTGAEVLRRRRSGTVSGATSGAFPHAERNASAESGKRSLGSLLVSALVLSTVWASVLTLASWTRPWDWASQSFRSPVVLLLLVACAVIALFGRDGADAGVRAAHSGHRAFRLSIADAPALLAFVILSFRTTPIVEFYHWSFWVGPIESIRQGGWLLWDVPSQYGFLSLLMPALLPVRGAWQALYLFQGILYVAVAIAIYVVLKGLRRGLVARVLAFVFTAATLFFRPRTSVLILSAQMTPAGGPMRFFWCYAILAVLAWKYWRGDKVSPRRFAVVGTLVWVASVAWSVESAIYCTVAWVAAFGVFVLQRAFAASPELPELPELPERREPSQPNQLRTSTTRRAVRNAAAGLGLLATAIALAVAVVTLVYRVAEGHGPDWASYYEYALLFSGGYSALPIDGYGAVWYLIVLFAAASTAVVQFLVLDSRHPRAFVAAGAWGTIWAVSSYFVSRSHPVNLLSLVPLLVFAFAIILHLTRSFTSVYWVRLVRLTAVPLICLPAALTWSHRGFVALLSKPQAPMSGLTAQVPAMDPSLASLAAEAGMKSSDPVFFASDGRYLLPRWPALKGGIARTNELAWMPKPYEMISTLPPHRRDVYVERFSNRIATGGWLIQKKSEINPGYESVVRLIEKSYMPVASFENEVWLIRRYETATLAH